MVKLLARTSDAIRAALETDTADARVAGLLDHRSGLPLSWVKHHERALDAESYPVAAQLASVVADRQAFE